MLCFVFRQDSLRLKLILCRNIVVSNIMLLQPTQTVSWQPCHTIVDLVSQSETFRHFSKLHLCAIVLPIYRVYVNEPEHTLLLSIADNISCLRITITEIKTNVVTYI